MCLPRRVTLAFPTVHDSGSPFGQLHPNQCKEQISIAYAHAVVTAARCKLERISVDDQSVDAVIMQDADHDDYSDVELDVQLKCTSSPDFRKNELLAWSLDAKNYKKLTGPKRYKKSILVVMVVPDSLNQWVTQSEARLELVQCAYWVSMSGQPPTNNSGSKTVHLPRRNIFNVDQLLRILQRVGNGTQP